MVIDQYVRRVWQDTATAALELCDLRRGTCRIQTLGDYHFGSAAFGI